MEHEVSLFTEFDLARLCRRARRFALFGGLAGRSRALAYWLAAAAIAVASCHTAAAHGIAGNRYFVGTLTFDDPAVNDEVIVPLYSAINYPAPGGNVAENRITWAFDRLLTPTLAVTYESGWIHQNWPIGKTSGLETTNVGLKYETYRDNRHEALVSVGVAWGIGQSGAPAVGADEPNTFQPGIFFGKGFGDLPDWLAWARPFAVTGAVVDAIPAGPTGKALSPNPATGKFQTDLVPQVNILHWGFSLQYSTYYLTSRFTGGPPKKEPLNQVVPLVEFSFDTPFGQSTAATMNPGFAYVAVTWQIAAEAIVPLNRAGGSGPGVRAQLMFFLDDLIPSVFGKPLLSDKPDRSLIAWH